MKFFAIRTCENRNNSYRNSNQAKKIVLIKIASNQQTRNKNEIKIVREIQEKFEEKFVKNKTLSIEIRNREKRENRDNNFQRKKITKKSIKISNDEFNDNEFNNVNDIDIEIEQKSKKKVINMKKKLLN